MASFTIDTINGRAYDRSDYSVEEMMKLDAKVSRFFLYFHVIENAQIRRDGKWVPAIVYISGTHRYIRYKELAAGEKGNSRQFYAVSPSEMTTLSFEKKKFDVTTNAAARSLKAGELEILCPGSRDFNIAVFSMQVADRFFENGKKLFNPRNVDGLKPYTVDDHARRTGLQLDDNKLITFSVDTLSFIVLDEFSDELEKGIMRKGEIRLQRRVGERLVPANLAGVKSQAAGCEINLNLGIGGSLSDYSFMGTDRSQLDHSICFYIDPKASLEGNPEKKTLCYRFEAYGRKAIEMHFISERDYYSVGNFLTAVIAAVSGGSTSSPAPAASGTSIGDIEAKTEKQKEETAPMDELNALIGLEDLKHDVQELISLVRMQKMREEKGMRAVPVTLHLVFTGNPGTGKTTVARILGKLYKEIGVLSKGQLVECDRSGLVAGYIGHTAIQTQKKIDEAMGGILFIDEAYTLAKEGNDFGQEAIDTLLKAMEDHRQDFVVIVAGYPDLMNKFINSNPGLKSRFNKYMNFPDYSAEELKKIFESNCKKYDYKLDPEAEQLVSDQITRMVEEKDDNFANAREIRNLFETIITNQASRVDKLEHPDETDMITITKEDVEDI